MPTLHPSLTGVRRVDAKRVVAALKKRESALRTKTMALALVGVPLSFIGPAVFTLLGWLFWAEHHRAPYPLLNAFALISAVSLPLLYWLAWSLRGSILERGAASMGTFAQRRAAMPMMILELANIGPRMVLHAVRCRGERRRSGQVDLDRAAEAICTLTMYETAIAPGKLLRSDEPPEQLEPLLLFLMFHQLIDIGTSGDRVWLNSDFRRTLEG